jgi:universal stress protein A
MSANNKILVAVDLTEEAPEVLAAAQRAAKEHDAELHILTVMRPINYGFAAYETAGVAQVMANFEPEARASAHKFLQEQCAQMNIDDDKMHVVFGRPSDVIKAEAKSLGASLIVLGSHGKHGLRLLLGSTANGVLHGATCDVYVVRIHENA